MHGPFNMRWRDTNVEIELREFIAIVPLMILILITGIFPNWILYVINNSVTLMMQGLS